MASGPVRAARFVLQVGAQAVPAAGVWRWSWPAAGGLALYWIESVLALAATALLTALFARRARRGQRAEGLREIETRRIGLRQVVALQGGAYAFWAVFFGAFFFILARNGRSESQELGRALAGVPVLAGVAALLLLVDLLRFRRLTAEELELRVGAGYRRFGLFAFVGLFGFFGAVLLNRTAVLFAVFAVLKTLFEIGSFFDRTPAKL